MLEPGSSCHFFSSIFLFGQSDFQVSKTIFDSREILFLELLLLFWSSCYFLELLLGSSIWWRELGETPSEIGTEVTLGSTVASMFWGEQPAIETTTGMDILVLNYVMYT